MDYKEMGKKIKECRIKMGYTQERLYRTKSGVILNALQILIKVSKLGIVEPVSM